MDMLLLDGWFKLAPGDGAFYAIFGFLFVFLGIALLIGIIKLVGVVMIKAETRHEREKKKESAAPLPSQTAATGDGPEIEDGIPPEVVAAISAALAVCLKTEQQKCGFVVRRIKKL